VTDVTYQRGVFSSTTTGSYHGTDGLMYFVGRTRKAFGSIPIIFGHDTTDVATRDARNKNLYLNEFRQMVDIDGYTLAMADLVGVSTYGNDVSIASIDELLNYLTGQWGSRKDKVLLYGYGMGALLALNWAWRNQTRVLGMVIAAPIVALLNYHDDNAGLQAAIDAAYTNHTGFINALPTHDPMLNIAKIQPFGDRIKVFYASDDALVHADDVETFAALTGADLMPPVTGGHSGLFTKLRPDDATAWLVQQVANRRRYEIDWKYNNWSSLRENNVTTFGSIWTQENVDAVGGRRGRTTKVTSPGNERRIYLPASGNVKMADSELYNEIYGGNANFSGQQGNFHRVTFVGSPPVSGTAFVVWQNIIFNVPWIVNAAVWRWMPGNPAAFNFGATSQFDSPGLQAYAGGTILGCSRVSNIATYVCNFSKIPRPGDFVFVTTIPDATFNVSTTVISVDPETNTFRASSPGADTPSGGPGKFTNLAFIFPFALRSQCYGESPSQGRLKVWPLGIPEPAWSDTLFSFSFTWTAEPAVYGEPAFLLAHIGDGVLTPPFLDQGRFVATEL
jgi:pimeloyl-ACP methyl ester carboxylesterase